MFKTSQRATWWGSAFTASFLIFLTFIIVIGVGARESLAQPITLQAIADAYIRTDDNSRRNDNYGCQQFVMVGTSQGGGGIPFGGADAMRTLIQFDLSTIPPGSVASAILELTILGAPYDNGTPTSVYTVNVHRALAPWTEGNGIEFFTPPSGCTGVDPADGVAWAGAGDNADPDAANNQTQPPFDPAVVATAMVNQGVNIAGDVIQFDITSLAQAWVNGTVPNYGILLRDPTSDGSFRGVRFGAWEGLQFGLQFAVTGPRLIVTRIPEELVSLDPATLWIGLKNSDDQGTQFDLRVEVYTNDTLVSDGITRCITGVTRNPNKAKEIAVPFGSISNGTFETGDELFLKISTRIGTNPDGTKCLGHSNAVGLRLYYDATSRPSRFGAELTPDPLQDFFLHSDGNDFLDDTAPTATTAKFKDSPTVNFAGGNPWKVIGTWSMTLP